MSNGTYRGREVISDEEYEQMIVKHHAAIDALELPDDAVDGRCMEHPRDCRCYWPMRFSQAVDAITDDLMNEAKTRGEQLRGDRPKSNLAPDITERLRANLRANIHAALKVTLLDS